MEIWYLIALFASFIAGVYVYMNQYFKMDNNAAMIYRGAFLAFALLPFIFFFDPIENPYFYIYCAIQGIFIYAVDSKVFKLSNDIGAEATSIYQPLTITAIFLVWFLINPEKLNKITENKSIFIAEILCLLIITYAVVKIKKAKSSANVLPFIAPLIALGVVVDIMNKKSMGMGGDNLISAVYYYNLTTAIVIGICSLIGYKNETAKYNIFSKKAMIAGGVILLVSLLLTGLKNVSMFYTPNPAYVTAILGVAPLWVIGINKVFLKLGVVKEVKRLDLRYTAILVSAITVMIILANY